MFGVKKTGAVVLFLSVALVACSSGSTSAPAESTRDSVAMTTVQTAAAVTSTTEAQLSTADEPVIPCDVKAFRAAFNTKMVMDACTTTWAVGNTDRDTWNCSKDGCSQVDLYHLVDNAWRSTATCHVDQPLTYWKGSCYKADMSPVTAADIPSPAIQCKIWPMNRNLHYISETGCEPTAADIKAMVAAPCTRWSDNPSLPLEKCDSGYAVKVLQKRLSSAGHSVRPDGYFGGETVAAVMAEQKKAGLQQTGLVDLPTWKALFPGNAGLKGTDSNGNGVLEPGEIS